MIEKKEAREAIQALGKLLGSGDIQEILDLGRVFFGNPIILASVTFTVIAMTGEPELTAANWNDIKESGGIPMRPMQFDRLNEVYRESVRTRRPVMDSSDDDGIFMLRKALCVGDRILAYMDSPLYYTQPSDADIDFFDLLGNLLTMQLQRNLDRAVMPDNMLDYFVYDILSGKLTDSALIEERFGIFDWIIMSKGKLQIISIQQPAPSQWNVPMMHELIRRLSELFPLYRSFTYEAGIRMLCPVSESLTCDAHFMSDLLVVLEQNGLIAGFSRVMDSVGFIYEMNVQASTAAELGRKLRPGSRVYRYDDLAIFHALKVCSATDHPLKFCHSAMHTLTVYDGEHDTELLKTLRVYLGCGQSISDSAAELFIHRNTMNYRISKIRELTGLDLTDHNTQGELLFSCCILDYLEKTKD